MKRIQKVSHYLFSVRFSHFRMLAFFMPYSEVIKLHIFGTANVRRCPLKSHSGSGFTSPCWQVTTPKLFMPCFRCIPLLEAYMLFIKQVRQTGSTVCLSSDAHLACNQWSAPLSFMHIHVRHGLSKWWEEIWKVVVNFVKEKLSAKSRCTFVLFLNKKKKPQKGHGGGKRELS